MLRRAVLHGSISQTQRWLKRVVLAGDPAAFLPKHAAEHLAATVLQAGVAAAPPCLGGESDPSQLMHPDHVCQLCSGTLSSRPSLSTQAVILDVTGPMRKEHVLVIIMEALSTSGSE